MKKVLFLVALVLMSAGTFAQKKNVSRAKNLALMEENPDFANARVAIGEALENEETKGLADTWYVAGLIGYREAFMERIFRTGNVEKIGRDVLESINYWLKADEIAMTPVYDKKGRPKYNTSVRRNIQPKMLEYYQNQELIQYGIMLNDQQEYQQAYDAFMTYLSIPDMPMMQDEKYKAQMPKDSTYLLYKYYTGRFAYANKNYDEAIRLFSDLVDGETENISSAEHIYQCYIDKGDSAKANEMLDIYIEKFPKEQWFMQNRINNLVSSGNTEAALLYLDKAIERAPQGQYYNSKASILSLMKRFEESLVSFEKALSMEPNNALFHQSYGYAYVDWGNMIYDAAQDLSAKEFNAELKKANEKFMQALPYFEKAYELEPENPDYKRTLRSLYYRLQMMDKYEALAN